MVGDYWVGGGEYETTSDTTGVRGSGGSYQEHSSYNPYLDKETNIESVIAFQTVWGVITPTVLGEYLSKADGDLKLGLMKIFTDKPELVSQLLSSPKEVQKKFFVGVDPEVRDAVFGWLVAKQGEEGTLGVSADDLVAPINPESSVVGGSDGDGGGDDDDDDLLSSMFAADVSNASDTVDLPSFFEYLSEAGGDFKVALKMFTMEPEFVTQLLTSPENVQDKFFAGLDDKAKEVAMKWLRTNTGPADDDEIAIEAAAVLKEEEDGDADMMGTSLAQKRENDHEQQHVSAIDSGTMQNMREHGAVMAFVCVPIVATVFFVARQRLLLVDEPMATPTPEGPEGWSQVIDTQAVASIEVL
jgi:hypothetical protein